MAADIRVRPLGAEIRPCKICGGAARLYGTVDLNRSCEEQRLNLPTLGIPVHYRRCAGCGFLFTEFFDDWTQAEFKQFIYNDDYIEKVDLDYLEARPAVNAKRMITLFGESRSTIRILDYGGGNGMLAQRLREAGFAHVETYDPFTPEYSTRPESKFDLITSYETFEHLPHPLPVLDVMVELLTPKGAVLFSTLVQPPEFDDIGMGWWYIGPRNGHVSLFSERALVHAWRRHGFTLASFSRHLHLAFRPTAEAFFGQSLPRT